MAVSVTSLSERFVAQFAFERHVVVVYPEMVSQIAKFRELERALFAL
jgi:hypothetical protein